MMGNKQGYDENKLFLTEKSIFLCPVYLWLSEKHTSIRKCFYSCEVTFYKLIVVISYLNVNVAICITYIREK